MNTHTPGPWQFYADTPSTDPNWHIVTNENRMRVIANVHIDPENKTDTANARLIAKAPELLNGLTDALEWLKTEGFGRTPEYARLKDIVSKAKGKA